MTFTEQAYTEKDYGIPDRTVGVGTLSNNPSNTNLALPTNFLFICNKIPELAYFVQEFTIPEAGSEPLSAEYLIGPTVKLPKSTAVTGSITLKFLVNEDFSNYHSLINWMLENAPYTQFLPTTKPNFGSTDTASLILLTNKKVPYRKFEMKGLIPTDLSGIEFTTEASDAVFLTATVKFSISEFKLVNL